MVRQGMSIARLNFSHGTLEDHKKDVAALRSVGEKLACQLPIFVDLPGPKIRVGHLGEEPVRLQKGNRLILASRDSGQSEPLIIPVTYDRLAESVKPGRTIYMNDGFIELTVKGVDSQGVHCIVAVGGTLTSGKGINLPGLKVFVDNPTDRDLEMMESALLLGIRIFGVSFVDSAETIERTRDFARRRGTKIFIIAKIERAQAVEHLDEILEAADAVMIARGDLGVEIPLEELPTLQKEIILKANIRCRPVITATQMLESMVENRRPTRAEATDVANAILDGTDAVMLSAETAIGDYPVEAVSTMARIAIHVEGKRRSVRSSKFLQNILREDLKKGDISVPDMISLSVSETVEALDVPIVLTPTSQGATARRIARLKPECWILAVSPDRHVRQFLNFSYGVKPLSVDTAAVFWYEPVIKGLLDSGRIHGGDRLIITGGQFKDVPVGTDSLGIITIPESRPSPA